ncbi:MAG TPA: DUF58 domain-containing protein [Actinomycetota bacterium]
MPRLRKRAASLLAGAILLFFLATNVQSGWLYVFSALLLGALLAGWLMPIGGLRGLDVTRHAPERVHQGDGTPVDLVVSNHTRGTRRGVRVRDPHLEVADIWLGTIRGGEQVTVTTLRTPPRRGVHAGDLAALGSNAPFGVAERRRTVAVDGPDGSRGPSTLVLPTLVPLGPLPFIEPSATTNHAIHSAPRRGHGPEYLGIREYRSGDSMRHVHWPSTARTGSVMVREFEQEQTRRLAVVVDAARDDGQAWTPLDRVCCAAASVCSTVLAQGNGALLITPGDGHGTDAEGLSGLDVSYRGAQDEILERLALLEPGGPSFPDVVNSLVAGPELRGVETAVLIFPTWRQNGAEALPPAVQQLAERILRVVAVPVVLAREDSKHHALEAADVAGLEQRLRAAGAVVYPWMPGHELEAALASGRVT